MRLNRELDFISTTVTSIKKQHRRSANIKQDVTCFQTGDLKEDWLSEGQAWAEK